MIKIWIKNKVLPIVANRIGTKQLVRWADQPIIHIFYHTVSDHYLPHIHPLYCPKTIEEFKNDLDFLTVHFNPVCIDDVRMHVAGEKIITCPSFHLSFDDGLSEVYNVIAPILWERGIPATLFVNKAYVNNKDLFFRYKAALIIDKIHEGKVSSSVKSKVSGLLDITSDTKDICRQLLKVSFSEQGLLDKIAPLVGVDFSDFLQKQRPYLEISELNCLQNKGFTIGGHSVDHPRYEFLDEAEQIRQTIESCDYVQQTWGEKHRYFAFPFTDAKVKASFFSTVLSSVDLVFGISGIKTEYNGRHIHRIDMEKPIGVDAEKLVNRAYLINRLKDKV